MLLPIITLLRPLLCRSSGSHNPFYASGPSGDCEGWQLTGSFRAGPGSQTPALSCLHIIFWVLRKRDWVRLSKSSRCAWAIASTPETRPAQLIGLVLSRPVLGDFTITMFGFRFSAYTGGPPAVSYRFFSGVLGSTAATPSGLMLKAKNINGSLPGFPHWCTRAYGS